MLTLCEMLITKIQKDHYVHIMLIEAFSSSLSHRDILVHLLLRHDCQMYRKNYLYQD